MKNQQDYYFALLWRFLLALFTYLYILSGAKHVEILYNKDFSALASLVSHAKNVYFVPNILNYIPGEYIHLLWLSPLIVILGIFFRKLYVISGIAVFYILACFLEANPTTTNIGIQTYLMVLFVSAFVPIPYTRIEHENNERLAVFTNPIIYLALWINFASYYFYSGYTKITTYSWRSGLALVYIHTNTLFTDNTFLVWLFSKTPVPVKMFLTWYIAIGETLAPLAFLGRNIREKIWYCLLIVQIGLLLFMNLLDIQLILLIYSIMLFDPAWLPARTNSVITVHYDGTCSLCHGFITHILNIDYANITYFVPLQKGNTTKHADFDTLESVIIDIDGRAYTKYKGVLELYRHIGGIWRILSYTMLLVPIELGDKLYDMVAKNRYRIFGKEQNLCPLVPDSLLYKFKPSDKIS